MMYILYVERFGVHMFADGYYVKMVCIRKTIISGAALACRRVGSKRIKVDRLVTLL